MWIDKLLSKRKWRTRIKNPKDLCKICIFFDFENQTSQIQSETEMMKRCKITTPDTKGRKSYGGSRE